MLVLTYIMLGWGLNIVVGLAGLLDLGYVAFYAVGAYTYALMSTGFGLGFWTCLPLAGLFAAAAGMLLGFPVLRLRGDYLAIVTLAFGEIIRIVLINWTHLTGGPNGVNDIPRPTLFGLKFNASGDPDTFASFFGIESSPMQRVIFLYYVILVLALLTNWVTLRLRRLPLGRAWEALREDEIACRSLGINVTVTKLTAFAIGAMFGGFAGAFFATREGFVSPESFTFIESAIVLAVVVLGGLGSQLGVALAAVVMIGGLEILRDFLSQLNNQPGFAWLGAAVGDIGQYRMLIFGLALVVMMVLRPRGLVSGRTPSVALAGEAGDRGRTGGGRPWLICCEVEHLTMRFGGLTAVGDLSFSARAGHITSVIGPNGAGKTTVFNCITGFYRPSSGALRLTHADGAAFALQGMPGHRIARRARVARTFQNIRLFAGMTVLENLLVAQHNMLMPNVGAGLLAVFGLGGHRRAERAAMDRARLWLDAIGLLRRADDPAGALPYGDQRRLEIARAMCTGPVLLCLDEPAAGLNPRESEELTTLLRASATADRHGLLRAADRARHGRGDADLRPRRGAGPRQEDRRRPARRRARRPGRDRRLSRRGRRGRGAGSAAVA